MLKEHDQVMVLADKGEYVATYNNGGTSFVLYSLSTFFMELEQDNTTKKLVGRQIFQSGAQLEKYLPDTAISI